MEEKNQRRIWQSPWGYPESIAVACGLLLVGFLLQITIGHFNFYLLSYPANCMIGIALWVICLSSLWIRKSRFLRWFTGASTAISLIAALLILTIIMGLTPQINGQADVPSGNIFSLAGFDRMTHSWPFVLVYFCVLLSLGGLIVRRFCHFRWKDYAFYLNHIGLWLVFWAAGLGYADMERYVIHVREGEVEWRVYDEENRVKELPIAVKLNDFDMEEYPPKLTVIDRQSGAPQPETNPDYFQIDTRMSEGRLNGWKISVEQYIHQAVRNSDSTYREAFMPGATPAVLIKAVRDSSGKEVRGWVCGGNQAQLYMTLALTEDQCIVMTVAEPKRYSSDVEVYTPDGTIKKGVIEVNKPMRVGNWTIYQYGYDNQAGRLSSYSSLELVYDSWWWIVYIGFACIALGAVAMIWNGRMAKFRPDENTDHCFETKNI